jgi:hypothetical protein
VATRRRRRRKPAPEHLALLKANRHRYDAILELQGGGCAICEKRPSPKRRLDMDHDHHGMFIRGLLCHRCNRALPAWMTAEWLRAAAAYLEKGAV